MLNCAIKFVMAVAVGSFFGGTAWAADYSGEWRKQEKGSTDSITIKKTPDNYTANLSASYNTNFGDVTLTIPQSAADAGTYTYKTDGCHLEIRFLPKLITVDQVEGSCDAGMNVSFTGKYARAAQKKGGKKK